MVKGILTVNGATAEIDVEGDWVSSNAHLQQFLRAAYAPPATEAGTPWIIAFWAAAGELGADVVQEPVPDAWDPSPAAEHV